MSEIEAEVTSATHVARELGISTDKAITIAILLPGVRLGWRGNSWTIPIEDIPEMRKACLHIEDVRSRAYGESRPGRPRKPGTPASTKR
jgi:hypothetical protein